ncbi:MAG: hypothetical protein HQL37_03095 [Alphaproteobacteria bacterium]|nr:hypothetical protein [Alphaproteobacteria bacterium]
MSVRSQASANAGARHRRRQLPGAGQSVELVRERAGAVVAKELMETDFSTRLMNTLPGDDRLRLKRTLRRIASGKGGRKFEVGGQAGVFFVKSGRYFVAYRDDDKRIELVTIVPRNDGK